MNTNVHGLNQPNQPNQSNAIVDRATHPPVGIFISYSSENESLARKLKDKLEGLEDDIKLDVFVASKLGGVEWRKALWEKLADARLLILCYTSESMKLDWCSYEVGRFHAVGGKHTVCLLNSNLRSPPQQVAEWQAYRTDKEGLTRFFQDLFQQGLFTAGVAMNRRLTGEHFRERLKIAVEELEGEFARFRVSEHFYPYRISISSQSERAVPTPLSFKTARVTGDSAALHIFGITDSISWEDLKEVCNKHHGATWADELEQAASRDAGRLLTRSLSPFVTPNRGTYIPVISRLERLEDKSPWKINVIFVEIGAGHDLKGGVEGGALPDRWKKILAFLRLGCRFRWSAVEPVATAIENRDPDRPDGEWQACVKRFLEAIKESEREMSRIGIDNHGAFEDLFEGSTIVEKVLVGSKSYYDALIELKAAADSGNRASAAKAVAAIRQVNSLFLLASADQLHRMVEGLGKQRPSLPGRSEVKAGPSNPDGRA